MLQRRYVSGWRAPPALLSELAERYDALRAKEIQCGSRRVTASGGNETQPSLGGH